MKKHYFYCTCTLMLGLLACQSIPKADKAVIASKQQVGTRSQSTDFKVDTARSTITWTGTKPTGYHTGTFSLDQGLIVIADHTISGGEFVINIASLTDSDLQGSSKKKLEEHLKSADFFDVAKYPTARFEITRVIPFDSAQTKSLLTGATHLISGNLTLKDQTKNITFPSIVQVTDHTIEATANFIIDRTQWGLNYGSDRSLQDRFIRPEVAIQLDIKAKKQ
jgi:polyisoprenoid-binding protein YceI